MDSDDWLEVEAYEDMLDLAQRKNADTVGCVVWNDDGERKELHHMWS